jgi:hypothetical protein
MKRTMAATAAVRKLVPSARKAIGVEMRGKLMPPTSSKTLAIAAKILRNNVVCSIVARSV